MNPLRWTLAALATTFVIASPAIAGEKVTFTQAWVREAPPMSQVMAGYVTIENETDHPLVLQGVESAWFQDVQMHETYEEEGRTGMREVKAFTIPKGGKLAFEPGAAHLMLMHPQHQLQLGEKVPLTFDFGHDGLVKTEIMVRSAREMRHHMTAPSASPRAAD